MRKTTIEFSTDSSDRLATLAKSRQTTKADVLRNALKLYSFLAHELKRDKVLAIVGPRDTIEKIIVVPGLQDKEVVVVKLAEQQSAMIVGPDVRAVGTDGNAVGTAEARTRAAGGSAVGD